MYRLLILVLLLALSACSTIEKKGNRQVVALTSQEGHAFHFMPIYEDGVTDITVRFAWPVDWSRTQGLNPAVPYVGTEIILSGGTESLKPQEVMELFNDYNAQGRLGATPDHVFGELSFPREHIDETVAIASQMLANPQLDDQWMDRIKQGFITNQREKNAVSANQMWSAARLSILGDTPLFRTLDLSDLNDIEAVTRKDILDWHKKTFTQSAQTVVVTGAISQEDAGRVVDTLMQGLPEKSKLDTSEDTAVFSPATILVHLPEAEKTTLGFIGQLPPTSESGDYEDYLAVNLLSNSNGPLFKAIRTELRATYGLQAGFANYTRQLRPFFIFGEVETGQLAQARDVALEAYESFRLNPELAGLEELKTRVVSDTKKNVRFVDIAAQVMTELLLDGQDPTITPQLHERYLAITPQSLRSRLRDAFPPADTLMVMAVSPDKDALPGACVISSAQEVGNCQ